MTVAYRHKACGEIAFYRDEPFLRWDKLSISSRGITLPDGTMPVPGSRAICPHCGRNLWEWMSEPSKSFEVEPA